MLVPVLSTIVQQKFLHPFKAKTSNKKQHFVLLFGMFWSANFLLTTSCARLPDCWTLDKHFRGSRGKFRISRRKLNFFIERTTSERMTEVLVSCNAISVKRPVRLQNSTVTLIRLDIEYNKSAGTYPGTSWLKTTCPDDYNMP